MAVLTVLTVAVSAADYELYADGILRHTVELTAPEGKTVTWLSDDPTIATVDRNTGLVTAAKAGSTKIYAMENGVIVDTHNITVKDRVLTEIKITKLPTKTTYNSGDLFKTAGMEVTAVFDNGDEKVITDYTYTPSGALDAKDTKVTVSAKIGEVTKTADVAVTVNEITITEVKLTLSKTAFGVGDKLTGLTVSVTYSNGLKGTLTEGYDIYIDGNAFAADKKLAKTENNKAVKVLCAGEWSNGVTITVTEAPSFVPSFKIDGSFTNKSYKVGDKLDWTGVTSLTIYNNDEPVQTIPAAVLLNLPTNSPLNKTFTSADVGKASFVLNYVYEGNTYPIAITGLTVSASKGYLNPYALTDVVLVEGSYPTGYAFDIDDVFYAKYTLSRNGTKIRISGEDLAEYDDVMSLEVLTAAGNRKANSKKAYRSIIEEADIFTDNGDKVVNIRLYVGAEYVDTMVEVEEAKVTVSFEGKIIGVHEDIDDAIAQVNNLDTTEYPISGKAVTIKLGEDQRVSSRTRLDVSRFIEIDLNGCKLEFYSDTVNPSIPSFFNLTVLNTANTAGTFSYYDEDISLVITKDESFSFTKDYDDDDNLPGVYVVTLEIGKNGTVTANPKVDKNYEVAVGHGSKLVLTITPSTGYVVDELAIGRTVYDANDDEYTVNTKGVVTFTYVVTDDATIDISFKKGESSNTGTTTPSETEWKNPFVDVSSTANYYEAVKFVNQNGLFQGTTSTRFSPSTTMTRAMFVTVLGRLAGLDEATATRMYGTTSEFTDVNKNDPRYGYYSYAVPYIAWATQNGIIEGHGGAEKGTFGPEDPITHQQMYVIMQRYASSIAKKPLTSTSGVNLPYTDKTQIADWAEYAVKVAYVNDYIVTTGTNKISPTTSATRAELAMLIEKFAKIVLGMGVDEY